MAFTPLLKEATDNGIRLLVDEGALARGILIAFSDREGGTSSAPFDTLNLAARVGDRSEDVDENRRRVAEAAGFSPASLALARQVHGASVKEVPAGVCGVVGEADGLLSRAPGSMLGILTADCAPVVLAADNGVAVLHAGWRGLVAGVIERGVEALGEVWGAWVGPSIHDCCYEVGPEVVEAFVDAGLPASQDRVDPARAAAAALVRAGVAHVAVAEDCTSCSARYFSYRRDGRTGRQGAFVGLRE